MNDKPYLRLHASEGILIQTAATLFAGYLTSGRVPEGQELDWLETSAAHAIKLAKSISSSVIADDELG